MNAKRGSYVLFAVYFKQETITIRRRRISDFRYHTEQQQQSPSCRPFPYHYKILPWNSTTDYKILTIITEYSVSLPNTTEDKITKKYIYIRELSEWLATFKYCAMTSRNRSPKQAAICCRLHSRNGCYHSIQNLFFFSSLVWEFEG